MRKKNDIPCKLFQKNANKVERREYNCSVSLVTKFPVRFVNIFCVITGLRISLRKICEFLLKHTYYFVLELALASESITCHLKFIFFKSSHFFWKHSTYFHGYLHSKEAALILFDLSKESLIDPKLDILLNTANF